MHDVVKLQTRIHSDVTLTDEEWDNLQINEYQYIQLASDIDDMINLDSLLAGIRGACIKFGAAKKKAMAEEKAYLVNKIVSTNRLINLKTNPDQELLEKF